MIIRVIYNYKLKNLNFKVFFSFYIAYLVWLVHNIFDGMILLSSVRRKILECIYYNILLLLYYYLLTDCLLNVFIHCY